MPEQKAFVAAESACTHGPAAVFVRAVTETGLPVTIRKHGGRPVDARSLLEVMTADFEQGCEVNSWQWLQRRLSGDRLCRSSECTRDSFSRSGGTQAR